MQDYGEHMLRKELLTPVKDPWIISTGVKYFISLCACMYFQLAEEQPVQSASTETAASTPLSVTQVQCHV